MTTNTIVARGNNTMWWVCICLTFGTIIKTNVITWLHDVFPWKLLVCLIHIQSYCLSKVSYLNNLNNNILEFLCFEKKIVFRHDKIPLFFWEFS